MPGSLIVRPVQANITHSTDILGQMSPYCSFKVGTSKFRSQVCYKGGKNPHWNDALTIPDLQPKVTVDLMDKDKVTHDDHIGSFMFDLREVRASGQTSKWYPIYYKDKAVGEILVEAIYQPSASPGQSQYAKSQYYQELSSIDNRITNGQSLYFTPAKQYQGSTSNVVVGSQSQYYSQQQQQQVQLAGTPRQSNTWTEQMQVVRPHVFTKEIDVVETRSVLKEVEIMEPVKVFKEVQYTQAIPVKKQIEVSRPEVVKKDIEVMEPRLITKTIQVVENVTVTRPVQVVEMRNIVKEVETREPQTFTQKVELTEYHPVRKQIEVTEPVTLRKAVEFVEPVITTRTITKELREPVVVNKEVKRTIGPASIVFTKEFEHIHDLEEYSIYERERLSGLQRWTGYEVIFIGLTNEEKLWEQRRLSRLSEEEWIRERERLRLLSEQDRLYEQRRLMQEGYQIDHGFAFTHTYNPSPNF